MNSSVFCNKKVNQVVVYRVQYCVINDIVYFLTFWYLLAKIRVVISGVGRKPDSFIGFYSRFISRPSFHISIIPDLFFRERMYQNLMVIFSQCFFQLAEGLRDNIVVLTVDEYIRIN
ncbi:hypothetical protein C461_07689 [Halorubrum aidingense JCM 13560]|uniref:Uncharacterized protein n=1 Tax=Halorubrum aidingense JCM 13560 TaxID=1230454 RepID=M0PC47_9EURY|nr:hypothetical protein C461_07689 [Halorubrum aidingense JCM 13560]